MAGGVHFAEYPLQRVVVRSATHADAESLATRLRPADRAEVALGGLSPLAALEAGLAGDAYTIVRDGLPVAMFGVNRDQDGHGIIWLLGSNELAAIHRLFLRESRAWLERIGSGYPLLYNAVLLENALHIRWLQWLGFSFLCHRGPLVEFVKIV